MGDDAQRKGAPCDVVRRFGGFDQTAHSAKKDAVVYTLFFLCTLATILVLNPPVLSDTIPTAALFSGLATSLLYYVHWSHPDLTKRIEGSFRKVTTLFSA